MKVGINMEASTKDNTKMEQQKEKLVMYRVIRDAYNQKFKIRTWLFSKILSHMMEKLGREGTIFYLMSSMRKIQKQNR